ncbi:unnamed protein product [Arctia plantaginis]|uniref:Odorant receptor n=1 Tax=Arctia plantaginis TaxID=874455 RepID=A0A8S1AIN6_ARCPL|nr:unnamed protein product [Arctia plantaginis]
MSSRNLKELSQSETSILVTLINGLNQNIGLPSYTCTSKHKVYWFFRVAAICFIMTFILQGIALFKAKDDPKRLFECFSILAFTTMGIFKLGSLQYNHNRWGYILKQICQLEFEQLNKPITSDADYQSDDEENIHFSEYVNSYTSIFKTTFSRLRKMYYFTLLIFILSPFLEPLYCKVRGLEYSGSLTELDKLLKNIFGVYVLVTTLTLCFVALQLNSKDMSIMQLASLFQYMCGTLTQLFLFCCYGDAVFNGSSVGMGQGPFGAAHWCLSPSIRRDLCILGAGMMRIRQLRAGPFNFLDLPLFVQIVRTAYSCYAVLGKKNV